MNFEGVLGHEFVGRVVQADEKRWIDKRVVGEINIACGDCEYCRRGQTKHCLFRSVLGVQNKNGAFAEFLTLPVDNLHLLPRSVSDTEGVFVEPLAAALEIFDQIPIAKKDSVLVLGDGKLGLLVAQVMKLKAGEVHCRGKYEKKLELLRKKDIQTSLAGERLEKRFDVVVEATGIERGLEESLKWIKPRGKIVLKTTTREKTRVAISRVVVDELQLIGSRCGPFLKAIDVLKRKRVRVEEMVDGDFPLEKAEQAFTMAREPGVMKVLITP